MTGCTLVSAFFPIQSKFPPSYYLHWAETFLSLDACLVLFTTKELAHVFKEKRGSKPTFIIAMEFEEIDTWRLYKPHWIAHNALDPEAAIHSPELYAIWAQKAFFVEKAVQMNVFNTPYFFWCDFGAFRNPDINPQILRSFPDPKYLSENKILLQSIQDLEPSEKIVGSDGIIGCASLIRKDRLVGGLWGGGAAACLRWKTKFQQMLEAYFAAGRFAGKDQTVMLSTLLKDPSLAYVVTCTRPGIDAWFFLEHLLSDEPNIYKINASY